MEAKKLLLFFLLMGFQLVSFTQEKNVIHNEFELGNTTPIYLSYYGNLITHPGFKLGFDWNLLLLEKTKEKKKQVKTIRKLLLLTPSIAFYNHKASHKGLVISTDLMWRRYTKKLYYAEIGLGVAYFGRFNAGETWELNDDGSVTNIGNSSRSYFAPALSFGFGRYLLTKNNTPLSVFTKINTNALVGYNASVLPEISLELGISVTFNKGIKTGNTKTITKTNKR